MAQRPDDSVYEASLRELLTTNPSSQRELAHLAKYVDAGTPLYGGSIGAERMQAYHNGYSIPNDLGTLLAVVPGNALADYQSRTRASKAAAEEAWLNNAWADHYISDAGSDAGPVAVPPRPADWRPTGWDPRGLFSASWLSGNDGLVNFDAFGQMIDRDLKYQDEILAQPIDPNAQYVTFRDAKHWGAWEDDPAQYATQYAKYGETPASMDRVPMGLLRDKDGQLVKLDGDVSRFVGMETIRPGELDNAVNGLKEQLGSAFDANWNQRYAPKLANLPEARRNEIYQKTRDQFWNTLDWSDYIKYDPLVGMYTNMGAVKHVNDQKFDLLNDRVAPIAQTVMAAVVTGPMAAQAGAAAGSAASSAVGGMTAGAEAGAAGGAAAGSTAGATAGTVGGATAGGAAAGATTASSAAGTIVGGATQGLVGSLIGSAMTGNRVTGKNLATSMLMGGLTPYANANWAQYLSKPGVALLLEAARQAATNKGRIDPRTLAANTAGNLTAGWVGDKLSDSGIVGRLLGGSAGSVVRQSITGNGIDGNSTLLAGIGNTSTAGQLLAKAAGAYQRQMALRQQLAQRGGR